MTATLFATVREELSTPIPPTIAAFAEALARKYGAAAALFYGSALRTGDLDGVLDFYLLTEAPHRRGPRGLVERCVWPEVSYHEMPSAEGVLRAKVATMTLATFRRAAAGRTLDTTIWARFVQPVALAWARDAAVAEAVTGAVADAAVTAARFAAALCPARRAEPAAFWKALFRRTYAAEFRVERPGREDQVLAYRPGWYEQLLPLAWAAAGVPVSAAPGALEPRLGGAQRLRLRCAWTVRSLAGKPLGLLRLAKAAFTFEGAARYAAWKIERHTGIAVPLTPWRVRYPLLAAPGVLWRLWRARRAR
jgi:hypothetical protein